jgi:hypothetical protein
MKSQALQDLVKKIFGDEKTKAEFLSNPDGVLDRYELSEPEKKAVLNLHAKVGLATADSQQLEAAIGPTWTWNAPEP